VSGAQHAYRADSFQAAEPDWATVFAEEDTNTRWLWV